MAAVAVAIPACGTAHAMAVRIVPVVGRAGAGVVGPTPLSRRRAAPSNMLPRAVATDEDSVDLADLQLRPPAAPARPLPHLRSPQRHRARNAGGSLPPAAGAASVRPRTRCRSPTRALRATDTGSIAMTAMVMMMTRMMVMMAKYPSAGAATL